MSPPEIAFLALGLALGAAAGAALLAVVRPHAPLRPVVRVTVTPSAMLPRETRGPGFSATTRFGAPPPGSPDEDARLDHAEGPPVGVMVPREAAPAPVGYGTPVPSRAPSLPVRAVGIPIVADGRQGLGPLAAAAGAVAVAERPVASGAAAADVPPAARSEVRSTAAGSPVHAMAPGHEAGSLTAADPAGIPAVAGATPSMGGGDPSVPAAGRPSGAAAAADPCAGDRTQAAAACAAADETRDAARALADRLRDAERSHTELQARVDEAHALADPRHVAAEKGRLHDAFKAAHGAVSSAEDAEAAARDWLTQVSALNAAARDAARRVKSGTEELRAQATALERLELEASAARISAERAEDACRAAREQLAACEERQRPAPSPAEEPGPAQPGWPGGQEPALERQSGSEAEAERIPVVLRVLRGETAAREQLVASLASGDASATAAWHVRIAKFVDAVVASAIEDGFLDVPPEDAFWRLFSGDEQREIVLALSALGFRFDGLRGFADDRAPSARDLSLAVGYAGLDRMRIRNWPSEAALARLFDGATVRADLWLADQADDLALGRVEAALGARAAGLDELWDAWGRVRPAMLEER